MNLELLITLGCIALVMNIVSTVVALVVMGWTAWNS
jgi:hypothetical protein